MDPNHPRFKKEPIVTEEPVKVVSTAYEPHTDGCAKCGREMGEHPWPLTEVNPKFPSGRVFNVTGYCEGFVDPDFESEEVDPLPATVPIAGQLPESVRALAQELPDDWEGKRTYQQRSEVHGVTTAGYADGVREPIFCDTPGCGQSIPLGGEGHPEICPRCLKRLAMLDKRKEEIERVQPAFRWMWKMYAMGYFVERDF